jgi:protein-S-isoprenylcysteine O-methyltransferase Ste14
MYQVTQMTEERILRKKSREKEYLDYVDRTSMWIPWFSKEKTE